MILRLAWRNIWRNKRRSLITAASVTFALFFAIILRSFQLGTYDNVYSNVIGTSTGYIQIHQKGYWDEPTLEHSMEPTPPMLSEVSSTEGVKAAVQRLESFSLISSGNDTKGALLTGINPEAEEEYFNFSNNLIEGEVFKAEDRTVVLSSGLAEYLSVGVNDTIVTIGSGYHGVSANGKYSVAGIVKLSSPELNKRMVYLPLKEAQAMFGTYGRITSMVIVPENEGDFEEVAHSLSAKLDTTSTFEVMTWRQMMPELIQAMEADSSGGLVILFILYLVISFGVFGTILMLTSERVPEFGILISIGMSRGKIAIITFLEILFLALLGLLLGWILALPIISYYHYNPIQLTGNMAQTMIEYGFEPIMPMSLDLSIPVVHSIGVMIITIILSSYAPWIIYKLNPVTAVRK